MSDMGGSRSLDLISRSRSDLSISIRSLDLDPIPRSDLSMPGVGHAKVPGRKTLK